MNLKLEIRRNADGVIAVDTWADWDFNLFWWEEGNASCDCNRGLFFLRALNEDDDVETECGEGRYSVRLTDADTGAVLYDEYENSEDLRTPFERVMGRKPATPPITISAAEMMAGYKAAEAAGWKRAEDDAARGLWMPVQKPPCGDG